MGFFQNSVLNKYLNGQDAEIVKKAYLKFTLCFHNPEIQQNIRNANEEQWQEGFLRELFVNVLGYILNPNPAYNLTTEHKNEKGAKKADGAILHDGKALGVIELKGTDTKDLDKINAQAFNYKNNQTGCIYVVTSNFEKLRFFIHNSVEHLEFNLFKLSEAEFKILWLCLAPENVFAGVPVKVKEESLQEENKITKQLYKDYTVFKTALWQNIVKNRPETDKLLLFKKTQKLLDRFLFILFAEDKGLLPPNSIRVILKQWESLKDLDEYQPLYNRFKKYFGYLNKGWKGKEYEIFAYNGGLFVYDEILDEVNIDDDVLKPHIQNLTTYDFESEVDVNILGHIFEHSLSEIENVTADLEGRKVEKSKSKRKKDGVFYTPKHITKYIVDGTLDRLCEEKKVELEISEAIYEGAKRRSSKRIENLQLYRNWLLQLTICDPACGSGAFLNQALEFLINEHRYLDEVTAKYHGASLILSDIENHILEKNLYGVDINEESVEIAKLSLWLRTARKGRKLTSLNNNIKCGNSLIDDVIIAGENAFDWQKEFPGVFEKGGFDIIIGNPPYVFARDNFTQKEKDYYGTHYVSADYQINTYLLFIEKTIKITKERSKFGLIVPNAWLMVSSGKGLRKFILDTCKVKEVINLEGYSFEGVNVETVIILLEKPYLKGSQLKVYLSQGKDFVYSHSRNQDEFLPHDGFEFKVFSDHSSLAITEKLKYNSVNLDSIVEVKAGLQAYEKGKGDPVQTAEDVVNRPYDYKFKFDNDTHKYLEGKDVNRYSISWSGLYLKYGKHLAAPRTFNLFEGKKIIVREITGKHPRCIISTYSEELYLYNRSNIAILEREGQETSLKYITAIINSSLLSYYFTKNTAKAVRKMFPKIILNDLKLFPIKKIPYLDQQPFIEKVDEMLKTVDFLQSAQLSFIELLTSKFEINKISKQLKDWPSLNFKQLLVELKASKIKLSLNEEADWMKYFNEQKQTVMELTNEVKRLDNEIDQMVHELYQLTEDEIRIVEHGVIGK